ncbi:piggyBac transposable element-derived protein 3-like, partial [Anoplophora glabripennis]|uniref:piggyBac transposable element-derived protein 3-like n=1 Tax=Anoplophora glabripennis TaxID=217634 RepID=UPI0008745DA8
MSDCGVGFARGFSLNEALSMLEDQDDVLEQTNDITIFPPQGDITDEDSGDENVVEMSNLPASQLQAPAEINLKRYNNDDFSSEDELPLARLISVKSKKKSSKKKKVYEWIKEDLPTNNSDFTSDSDIPKIENLKSPLELFQDFFDEDLLDLIVLETNRYTARKNNVQNISTSEIKAFIGVLVLSGYVCVPRRRIYWEREKDGHNPLVSEAITRDKFEYILTNIHVKDNETLDKSDRFSKVRPLFDHLNKKFTEVSPMEEMHCVDEAMVPYFGRHGCKQFIHGKPIRYGYKLWVGATRLGF